MSELILKPPLQVERPMGAITTVKELVELVKEHGVEKKFYLVTPPKMSVLCTFPLSLIEDFEAYPEQDMIWCCNTDLGLFSQVFKGQLGLHSDPQRNAKNNLFQNYFLAHAYLMRFKTA